MCTAGEMVSAFWWTPAIRQAHIVSVNWVSLARRSNRAKSSSPLGCSGGGRGCMAKSEWGIGCFITNLIECQRNNKMILFSGQCRDVYITWSGRQAPKEPRPPSSPSTCILALERIYSLSPEPSAIPSSLLLRHLKRPTARSRLERPVRP